MIFDNKEVEFTVNFVKGLFKETGRVSPMAVGITESGEKRVVLAPWRNDEEKVRCIAGVSALFRSQGVKEIVFMTEAWGIKLDKEEVGKPFLRPSENPNRYEMVTIVYTSATEGIFVTMPITRVGSKASLGEPEVQIGDYKDSLFGDYFKKGESHDSGTQDLSRGGRFGWARRVNA